MILNFNSKNSLFEYILSKHSTKKSVVLIRGSTAHGKIKEYSDLDVEIYSSKIMI
jgi:predicted nucleotidyltransferase